MGFVYYLATVSVILLGSGYQYYLVTTNVPFRHPWLFVAVTNFGGAALWSINNYVLPSSSAAMDLAVILGSILSAVLFATKGNKLKGALAMTIHPWNDPFLQKDPVCSCAGVLFCVRFSGNLYFRTIPLIFRNTLAR